MLIKGSANGTDREEIGELVGLKGKFVGPTLLVTKSPINTNIGVQLYM